MRKLKANQYEIGFPEGWIDQSTVVMIGPPREGFTPNIQVHQEVRTDGQSVQDYLAEQRGHMAAELQSFNVLQQGDKLLGGQQAFFHVYNWTTPQGILIRQMQIMTQRSGVIYTVTASATEQEWPAFDALFDMAIATFQFTA